MEHRYWYVHRRPAAYTEPEGWLKREEVGGPDGEWVERIDHYAYGWVTYPIPLSRDHVRRFGLIPDDKVEQAHAWFYDAMGGDQEKATRLEQEQLAQPRSELKRFVVVGWDIAKHALVLQDARVVCPACQGTCWVAAGWQGSDPEPTSEEPCGVCNGTGWVEGEAPAK